MFLSTPGPSEASSSLYARDIDALGACPDAPLAEAAPATVRDAVNYGRSVSES